MRTAGFGPDPKGFAIVWSGILRLPLGHQQVSKKLVGIRKSGIGAQGRLQLALRLFEMAGPAEQHRIVVPSGGIGGTEPQRDVKLIPRLTEFSCSRKKAGEIAVRVCVVRPNPYRLSKYRLGACLLPSRDPQDAQVVVRLGQIRIQ